MRILVTGSNGFIGGHVCCYLKEAGCEVIGLGRRAEPSNTWADDYISWDLSQAGLLTQIAPRRPDAVVHLAADMRHEPYEMDVVRHNCIGTQQLLECCESLEINVFVQLSSLPVIGQPVEHPITEAHPLRPYTVYHITKRMQEMLADYAHYTHSLRTVSFRIPSPVGAGMNPKTIFPTFVRQALSGERIALFGNGTREQTYIHPQDIAQAIYGAVQHENVCGIYNLGSYNRISNRDLAQRIVEVLDSTSEIVFQGEDPLDTDIWDISIEQLQKDMQYQPEIGIDEMILELADSFKLL